MTAAAAFQSSLAGSCINQLGIELLVLRDWLLASALPLWHQSGIDRTGWGLHESLNAQGLPVAEDRRCRVQARQIFAFAECARLGWDGGWREAVETGLAALRTYYRRSDGLYRTLVSP